MSNLTRELRHFANAWCALGNADLFTDAADEITRLRDLIPAPALSRALVQASPHQVEACGAFEEVGE